MRVAGCIGLALLFGGAALLNAQEVRYVDLTAVTQRTELRHPPAQPSNCKDDAPCVGGAIGGGSVGDGAPDWRDPHSLGVYFLSSFPAEINAVEQFEVEFKVVNTGLAPIELPVWPHLSDLQESDVSSFTYTSLALAVRVLGEHPSCVPCLAYVELYGVRNREESTVSLRPGEWIRVKAKMKFDRRPTGAAQVRADFWLHTNTFIPEEGGGFTQVRNVYPNVAPTPVITVHFSPNH